MVAVILAFIFFTPREFFRDQPRVNHVQALAAEHGLGQYWIEPAALDAVSENQRQSKAVELIRQRFGRKNLVRLEPIFNEEQEIRGYIAYTRP